MVLALSIVFLVGYLAIALEHPLKLNKAASALLLGVICWVIYVVSEPPGNGVPEWFSALHPTENGEPSLLTYQVEGQLLHLTGEVAGLLFFVIGAMTIVELVDVHEGFSLITARIKTRNIVTLLWVTSWLTFFMSSVLDNLTTTIVMVSVLRRLLPQRNLRWLFAGMVVVAANAGGAWTVIGDVTTTMLWMRGKLDPLGVMQTVFIPSVICLLVPLLGLTVVLRRKAAVSDFVAFGESATKVPSIPPPAPDGRQWLFLILGLAGLLSVPIFKTLTHLPPFMGMLLSLGVLWVVSEVVNSKVDEGTRTSTGVAAVLRRIDFSAILFFLGILLAVGALGASGLLQNLAAQLDVVLGDQRLVAIVVGLVSAVVDNVPLVAAGIDMYTFPPGHSFWQLLAYCAGTGGSCLIIGSAAGVAAMGLEEIDFIWYLKHISPWALLGYLAGVGYYVSVA